MNLEDLTCINHPAYSLVSYLQSISNVAENKKSARPSECAQTGAFAIVGV